jgi:hypothetical protein
MLHGAGARVSMLRPNDGTRSPSKPGIRHLALHRGDLSLVAGDEGNE